MLNFRQVNEKITGNGYRRKASTRTIENEDGTITKMYDYEHRKKLDMFTVYTDEEDNALYAEYTKVDFDRETKRFSQQVYRIDNTASLTRYL